MKIWATQMVFDGEEKNSVGWKGKQGLGRYEKKLRKGSQTYCMRFFKELIFLKKEYVDFVFVFSLFVCLFAVPGIESRDFCMLGKYSTIKPYFQPCLFIF